MGSADTCVRYSLAACLYEQVYALTKKYCQETVNLSQRALASVLIHKSRNGNGLSVTTFDGTKIHVEDLTGRIFKVKFSVNELRFPVKYEQFADSWQNTGHVFRYRAGVML